MSESTTSASRETTARALAAVLKSARDLLRKDKGLNGDLDRLPLLTWVMFLKFLDDLEVQRFEESKLAGKAYRPLVEAPYRWRDWASPEDGITGDALLSFVNGEECVRPDGTRGPGLFAYLRSIEGGEGDDRRDVIATVFRGVDNRVKSGYILRDVINKISGLHFSSSEELHTLGSLYESMLREMRDAAGDSGEFYTPRPVVEFMVEAVDPKIGESVVDPACGTGGFLVEAFKHLRRQVKTVQQRRIVQQDSIFGCEAKPLPYLLAQMNLLLHGLDSPKIDPHNALRFKLSEIGDRDRFDVVLTNPPFGGEEERGLQGNFPEDRQTSETALLFLQLIMRRLRRSPRGGRAAVIVPNTTLFYPGVAARIRRDLCEEFNLRSVVRLPKGVFLPYTDIETNILFFDRAEDRNENVLFYRLTPPDGRKQFSKTLPVRRENLAECLDLLRHRSDASPNAWFVPVSDILSDPRVSLDVHNPKAVRTSGEDPTLVAGKLSSALVQLSSSLSGLEQAVRDVREIVEQGARWREIRLADVLVRKRDAIVIEDGVTYTRLRIQVKGRGVVVRDAVDGAKIGTKRQFVVGEGQFVLSKIDARYGAFGIVPPEGDGAIITGNFWAYEVDEGVVLPRMLHYLTRSDAFLDFCARSSPGATNRRYLQEPLFLQQQTMVPSDVEDQLRLCAALERIEAVARAQERDLLVLSKRSPVLLQSALHLVFKGEARAVDDEEEDPLVLEQANSSSED